MTNRTILRTETNQISNCFNVYRGSNVYEVKRNNLILSVVRKIN